MTITTAPRTGAGDETLLSAAVTASQLAAHAVSTALTSPTAVRNLTHGQTVVLRGNDPYRVVGTPRRFGPWVDVDLVHIATGAPEVWECDINASLPRVVGS